MDRKKKLNNDKETDRKSGRSTDRETKIERCKYEEIQRQRDKIAERKDKNRKCERQKGR